MTPEERAEAFIGQRFGHLVVTGVVGLRAPRGGKKKMMYVTCDCDCGRKDHIIMLDSIRYGKSYSCGCGLIAECQKILLLCKCRKTLFRKLFLKSVRLILGILSCFSCFGKL